MWDREIFHRDFKNMALYTRFCLWEREIKIKLLYRTLSKELAFVTIFRTLKPENNNLYNMK